MAQTAAQSLLPSTLNASHLRVYDALVVRYDAVRLFTPLHTDTQTHRHTDTQTRRHADAQTHRHKDTQTYRHTDS